MPPGFMQGFKQKKQPNRYQTAPPPGKSILSRSPTSAGGRGVATTGVFNQGPPPTSVFSGFGGSANSPYAPTTNVTNQATLDQFANLNAPAQGPIHPSERPEGYYDSIIPESNFWDDLGGALSDPLSTIETGGDLAPSEFLHDPLEYGENLITSPGYSTGSNAASVMGNTDQAIGEFGDFVLDPADMVETGGELALSNLRDDSGQYGQDLVDNLLDPSDVISGGGINDFQNDVTGLVDDTVGNYHSLLDDTRGNINSLIDDTTGNIDDFVSGGMGDAFGIGGGDSFGTGEGGYTPFGEKALDYLMDFEQLPREFRDQALPSLYGMAQEDFAPTYEQLTADPLYQSQLRAGEEAALRHGSVTGGKRGTDINRSLASNSQRLLEGSYNRQLQDRMRKQNAMQGFAFGQPNNTNQISNLMLGIDENAANQMTAQAQMEQARMGQLLGAGSSLAGGLLNFFSDPKLKKDVECIGDYKGLNWCRWIWNEAANKMGLAGVGYGVMADEVEAKFPDLAGNVNGYKTVNYGGLIDAS